MVCTFCNESKPLVRAHIIPHCFFRAFADPQLPGRLVSTRKSDFPKRAPVGPYDTGILCADCEARFSPYDDYGCEFFHPKNPFASIARGTETVAYVVPVVDYAKLKLFILSVLWRASVSTHEFYAGVDLGPYQDHTRLMINMADPGPPDAFPIFFERFHHDPSLVPTLCPVSVRRDGITYYQFMLSGFLVNVKVDKRVIPNPIDLICLQPNKPLHILAKDFDDSREFEIMLQAVRAANVRT